MDLKEILETYTGEEIDTEDCLESNGGLPW